MSLLARGGSKVIIVFRSFLTLYISLLFSLGSIKNLVSYFTMLFVLVDDLGFLVH